MKKLLGLGLCACVAMVLAVGVTGCVGEGKGVTKSLPPQEKAEPQVKDIPDVELKKEGGVTKVKISLTAKADDDLTLSIKATDKVKATGSIKKGEEDGELTITTESGLKADLDKLTLDVAESKKTAATTKDFKVKVK